MVGIDAGHDDDVGGERLRARQATQEERAGEQQKVESRKQKPDDGGSRVVQGAEEERAAIRAMLSKGAESAPAAAGVGRAPALAWAGLRLAAMVLLAAGVGIGLGDGDEFDDVGCSTAQQPEGGKASQGKAEMLKSEGGGQGPEHPTSNIQHRTPNVGAAGKAYQGKDEMLKAETLKPEVEEPSLSLAAKVFELLTALDPGNRVTLINAPWGWSGDGGGFGR
jgi:hypothetical protein